MKKSYTETRKTDTVRNAIKAGDYMEALRIARKFVLGIDKQDRAKMNRAYECIFHPSFYQQIGYNPTDVYNDGVEVVKRLYGNDDEYGNDYETVSARAV